MTGSDIDDDIDYVALAYALMAMPQNQRKAVRFAVQIMNDNRKSRIVGSLLALMFAAAGIGAAVFFRVPVQAFWIILAAGFAIAVIAILFIRRIL